MKTILKRLILVLALVLAPLAVLGQGSGPAISISPDDLNTGDISQVTTPFTQVFTVTNSGNALLSIAKIKYT